MTSKAGQDWTGSLSPIFQILINKVSMTSLEKSFILRLVESKNFKKLFLVMVQKLFEPCRGEKNFFDPCKESGGMLRQKILKISVLRLAENAFPTFWTHQFVNKMLRNSSNRGNWCCLTRKLFEFTAYLDILVMYHRHECGKINRCILGVSRGQTRRLGRSVYIEASWLNLLIFLHFFAT